jgi:hypothetical protein
MFNLPEMSAALVTKPSPARRREELTLAAYVLRIGYVL